MQSLRRTAVSSTRKAAQASRQQPCRFAHDAHPPPAKDVPHEPVEEPLGRGFYITIAAIPASFALYKFSRMNTDEKPWLTRWIDSYSNWRARWTERNDLHTKAIEQSAFDRNLFMNSKPSAHVELKFPEIFNTGSPYNVPAGHGSANLDKLIEHYEKQNFEEQQRKLRALREGNLKAEKEPQRPIVKNAPNP